MQQINDNAVVIAEMKQKCQHLVDCEKKLADMADLEKELLTVKEELSKTSPDKDREAIQVLYILIIQFIVNPIGSEAKLFIIYSLQSLCQLKDEEINRLRAELDAAIAHENSSVIHAEASNKTDQSNDQSTQKHTEVCS